MIYANRKETQPFKQLFISTVFKDDRDILWLAHKQGLTAWDLKNDSLHWFDVNNGLCDNLINSITQDNHGNMWLATSNGLSILEVTPDTQEGVDFSFKNLSTSQKIISTPIPLVNCPAEIYCWEAPVAIHL